MCAFFAKFNLFLDAHMDRAHIETNLIMCARQIFFAVFTELAFGPIQSISHNVRLSSWDPEIWEPETSGQRAYR